MTSSKRDFLTHIFTPVLQRNRLLLLCSALFFQISNAAILSWTSVLSSPSTFNRRRIIHDGESFRPNAHSMQDLEAQEHDPSSYVELSRTEEDFTNFSLTFSSDNQSELMPPSTLRQSFSSLPGLASVNCPRRPKLTRFVEIN
jgi:hypothetical protein